MTEQIRDEQIVDEQATEPKSNPFDWIHSIPDACSSFVVGPWTALVGDPVETPQAIRVAGRYISRGFLRHSGGRSLGRDFPGNTQKEALLRAYRWAEGSIQMWLRALNSVALSGPPSVISYLPPIFLEKIGAVNPSARIAPQPPAEVLNQLSAQRKERKGRRRKRRRR